MIILDRKLTGISRCPHCGVSKPLLSMIADLYWAHDALNWHMGSYWGTFSCSACKAVTLARTGIIQKKDPDTILQVDEVFPSYETADHALPDRARTFLDQALQSLHAPDGAVMLAAASIDAMLKDKGLSRGSLYERIDQAVEEGVLTQEMGDWAHDVRLGSNRPRHADENQPHVSSDEAKQAVEFSKMLGHILYTLPAKISKNRSTLGSNTP